MHHQEIAEKLAKLGRREARHMAKLQEIQAERCELLQACAADTGDEEIIALAAAPKTEPE